MDIHSTPRREGKPSSRNAQAEKNNVSECIAGWALLLRLQMGFGLSSSWIQSRVFPAQPSSRRRQLTADLLEAEPIRCTRGGFHDASGFTRAASEQFMMHDPHAIDRMVRLFRMHSLSRPSRLADFKLARTAASLTTRATKAKDKNRNLPSYRRRSSCLALLFRHALQSINHPFILAFNL